VALDQAKVEAAQLNLSNTTINAAQPGRVVNLTGAVGQYAQAGTTLTNFVPDEIPSNSARRQIPVGWRRPLGEA
jgi:membrane fusion protein (multidrug efflux system)